MAYSFKLPDIGEGIHEGEIVSWLVAEGDGVEEDQDIVEVMTDKATVQISSPVAGTIGSIEFEEGETVNVGDVFVVIETDGDAPSPEADPEPEEGEGAAEATEAPAEPRVEPASPAKPARGNGAPRRTPSGVLAPPSVRIEARKRGIDLANVSGSARGGRITLEDLEEPVAEAASRGSATAAFELSAVDRSDARGTEPVRAQADSPRVVSARAKALSAHFSYSLRVSADALATAAADRGDATDLTAFVVKAVATALADHPRLAGLVDEGTGDLVVPRARNIAVALPRDGRLVLRVVEAADEKGLDAIAAALEKGAAGHGVLTVTALGALGGVVSMPVLQHPQVTGVGVGALRDVARLDDGEVVPGKELVLSFTFDHRYIDGFDGALFAQDVAALLEAPSRLAAWSRG